MKQIHLLLASLLLSLPCVAQIPNPGFETRRINGSASNWAQANLVVISTDSNCAYKGWDSILAPTTDAHTGNYAQEVRVAVTCADGYSGILQSNMYDSVGFFDQRIPVHGQPASFSFYYKLYSVQGDYGVALATFEDPNGNLTQGRITVPPTTKWTRAIIPMNYTAADTGGLVTLRFSIGNKDSVHYGTRLLIDDIDQALPAGITAPEDRTLACVPSPTSGPLSLLCTSLHAGDSYQLTITDVAGRVVSHQDVLIPAARRLPVDARSLTNGIYYLRLTGTAGSYFSHFVKQD